MMSDTDFTSLIDEMDRHAEDDGLTPSAFKARETAIELWKFLTECQREYDVSLGEDGDLIIYTGNREKRMSIHCRADGGTDIYFD